MISFLERTWMLVINRLILKDESLVLQGVMCNEGVKSMVNQLE